MREFDAEGSGSAAGGEVRVYECFKGCSQSWPVLIDRLSRDAARAYCRLNRTMNADFPPPGKNCIQVHANFPRRRKVRVHSSIQTTVRLKPARTGFGTEPSYSAFRNFFPKICLILKNRFLVRLSSNFQERLFMPSSSPNFFFGGVIFKITAAIRFFSPFPWKRSIYNSFFTNFV